MFDSHAHYDDKRFNADRYSLLDSLLADRVEGIVNIGCDLKTSTDSLFLASKYQQIYASVGIHPHEAVKAPVDYLQRLRELLKDEKAVAIGEIGLDYHYDFSPREVQKRVFREQMELARETGHPVIIHDREAHKDCLDMVEAFPEVKGVFHSFSGSAETAAVLTKAGWYISFSGTVTFKNAANVARAAVSAPTEFLLVETDCPYLAPHPHRGKLNHSGYLEFTIQKLAELRGTTPEEIEKQTTINAKRLFRI